MKKLQYTIRVNSSETLFFIDDVISGILTILKKGKPGELYWISSFKKTWFKKFANILNKKTGSAIVFPKTPNYTKKVDVGNFVVDNSKLRAIGWKPKFSLDEGISITLQSFKEVKSK